MLLQRRIDDVLEGVRLADLLHEESVVRTRVGLDDLDDASGADSQEEGVAHGARRAALPVLP
jgi:hypothetical protein